jgi:hypothetical protein
MERTNDVPSTEIVQSLCQLISADRMLTDINIRLRVLQWRRVSDKAVAHFSGPTTYAVTFFLWLSLELLWPTSVRPPIAHGGRVAIALFCRPAFHITE